MQNFVRVHILPHAAAAVCRVIVVAKLRQKEFPVCLKEEGKNTDLIIRIVAEVVAAVTGVVTVVAEVVVAVTLYAVRLSAMAVAGFFVSFCTCCVDSSGCCGGNGCSDGRNGCCGGGGGCGGRWWMLRRELWLL